MNDQDRKTQAGQSLVIIAVALIVVLIFAAIAVDLANAYVHRRTDQNAADAAALAGARDLTIQLQACTAAGLPISSCGVEATILMAINDFAERNGVEDTDGIPGNAINTNVVGYYLGADHERVSETPIGSLGLVHPDARGVEAIANSVAPSFFSRVLGIDGISISADAAVVIEGGPCLAGCVAPIATKDEDPDFVEGQCYNFWDGPQGTDEDEGAGSGNFGWLNWTSNEGGRSCKALKDEDPPINPAPADCSEGCLEFNLKDKDVCLSGSVIVGEWVSGATGVVNSNSIVNVLDCLGNLPNDGKKFPAYCADMGGARDITVIVYDDIRGTGCNSGQGSNKTQYHVIGFANFEVKGYALSGGGGAANGWTGAPEPDNPLGCLGPEASGGNRITGIFKGMYSTEGGGQCKDFGVDAPTFIR